MADEEKKEEAKDVTDNEEKKDVTTNKVDDDKKDEKSTDKTEEKKEKTFTQKDVDSSAANAKKAILKELGIKSSDDKLFKQFKAFAESQKTDDEKNQDKEKELEEANRRATIAESKVEAIRLGVKADCVDDMIALVQAKLSAGETDIAKLIGEFRTKYPEFFTDSDEEEKKKKGTGSSIKGKNVDKKEDGKPGIGQRLAAMRKTAVKQSYWKV